MGRIRGRWDAMDFEIWFGRRLADDRLAEPKFRRLRKLHRRDLDSSSVVIADPQEDGAAGTVGHCGDITGRISVALLGLRIHLALEVEVGVLSCAHGHDAIDHGRIDFTQPAPNECLHAR